MSNFVAAIDAEIADLERQLAAHPAYVKLRELRRVRAMYTAESARTGSLPAPASVPQVRPMASGTGGAIVSAVREFIADRTRPTPTREIMEMLARKGIEVGGANPQNVVSSSLSKAPDIQSTGRKGWLLVTNTTGDVDPAQGASPVVNHGGPSQPAENPAQGRQAGPGGGT